MFVMLHSEWVVNQHRDTLASYIGHHNLMEFFAIAENESKARVKFNFLQVKTLHFPSSLSHSTTVAQFISGLNIVLSFHRYLILVNSWARAVCCYKCL